MRVVLTEEHIEVRLAVWEKILGLLGNIRVARTAIDEAHMVEDPLGVAMSAGIKVGLRLPWLCYVARTIRLDQAFIVRRGLPGISFAVADGGRLARVLVSTPDAQELARSLAQS